MRLGALRGLDRTTPPAALLVLVLLATLWLLHLLSGVGVDWLDPVRRPLHLGVYLGSASLMAWKAWRDPRERFAWSVFATSIALGATGWFVYWTFVVDDRPIPYPSVADALWLAVYALNIVAVAALRVSRDISPLTPAMVVRAIAALALVWSAAIAVFYEPFGAATGASASALATNFAYLVGDITVVVLVLSAFALARWRPGPVWLLIGCAYTLRLVADVFWLYKASVGTWAGGGVVDSVWVAGPILVASAAWLSSFVRPPLVASPRVRVRSAASIFAGAVVVSVASVAADLPRAAEVLAEVAVAASGVALALAVREASFGMRTRLEVRSSELDALTGLPTHSSFQQRLVELDTQSGRRPFSLLVCDVVGLGAINAELGYQEGDRHLRAIGAALRRACGIDAEPYRTGGDQFAVLVPDAGVWQGLVVAERVLAAAEDSTGSRSGVLSVGVAERVNGVGRDELIRRARAALDAARRARRRIVAWAPGVERYGTNETVAAGAGGSTTTALSTALARAVDAKDSYTRSHCETVASLCVLVATELGFDAERIAKLRIAGLLHDVGKIGIPDAILHKPGPLTDEEYEVMKQHPVIGRMIVSGAGLEEEALWIYHHHERIDGRGYPDGLAGDEIPIESRIILVADAFEAMTADRPYRRGRPAVLALEELRRHAGTQFDRSCVEALVKIVERGSLPAAA